MKYSHAPQKGDKKAGEFTHAQSGITVPFYLRSTTFYCWVLEKEISAPDASVLRAKVMDTIEHWMSLEWFPVIEIQSSAEDSHSYRDDGEGVEFKLSTKRYYLSRSPAGNVVKVDWEVEELHRKAKMDTWDNSELRLTRLPLVAPMKLSKGRGRESHTLIDFEPDIWEALEAMKGAVFELGRRLKKLTSNREGLAEIRKLGSAKAAQRLIGGGK